MRSCPVRQLATKARPLGRWWKCLNLGREVFWPCDDDVPALKSDRNSSTGICNTWWWLVVMLQCEGFVKKLLFFLWFFQARLENEDFLIILKLIFPWRNADLVLLAMKTKNQMQIAQIYPPSLINNGGNSSAVVLWACSPDTVLLDWQRIYVVFHNVYLCYVS